MHLSLCSTSFIHAPVLAASASGETGNARAMNVSTVAMTNSSVTMGRSVFLTTKCAMATKIARMAQMKKTAKVGNRYKSEINIKTPQYQASLATLTDNSISSAPRPLNVHKLMFPMTFRIREEV